MHNNIHKGLLQFIFSGAYMKRWNDKLRPTEFIEIDKQAHKMIVAWLLCRIAGKGKGLEEQLVLEEEVVEGGIFDYLFRLIITDIKPPIFYQIKENKEDYARLAKWALGEAEPHLRPLNKDFWNRFQNYVMDKDYTTPARDILDAAHTFSSIWEYQLLRRHNNLFDSELHDIELRFQKQLERVQKVVGMSELSYGLQCLDPTSSYINSTSSELTELAKFANLCGQLRFQKRWSQTPRVPETSVMGHMFIVACFAYCFSLVLGACPARRVNNFFCGLFHDLPELLTRDIISPVKKSSTEFEKLIKDYERTELYRRVFTPLQDEGLDHITERLSFYLGMENGSEFSESILQDGKRCIVSFDALQGSYNENRFDPKDGEAIKLCDVLAAYIEAYTAMRNGIASDQIQQSFWRLREQYNKKNLGSVHIGALFNDFD